MKIRHPLLIKLVGIVGAWAVRLWVWTIRYRYRPAGPNVNPHHVEAGQRFIYAFWHENLLLPSYHYAREDVHALVSQHADGKLLTEIALRLGMRVVHGSSTRGGTEAVRKMLKLGESFHLAITPDGPRGPRRKVQQGLIYLASKTGLPIVPVGFAYGSAWRTRSWDQFVVPKPWSEGFCVSAPAITVPPDADRETLEKYRALVEEALLWATEEAERLAQAGRAAA